MSPRAKKLVVDTAGFVKRADFPALADEVWSLADVIGEVRDAETRAWLEALPFDVNLRPPSAQSLHFVGEFAKKTGDYGVLSATDLKVLALAWELHREAKPELPLPEAKIPATSIHSIAPKPPPDPTKPIKAPNIAGFHVPSPEEEERERKAAEREAGLSAEGENPTDREGSGSEAEEDSGCDGEEEEEEEESGDSEAEGWITAANLAQAQRGMNKRRGEEDTNSTAELPPVACLTTDFAMQNVLLQLRIPVLGLEGRLVKGIRSWILRCHGCFATTANMSKKFCPACGNATLKRVSLTVDPLTGQRSIHINARRAINTRGLVYSLPRPQGGKHARNPILCEDQPLPDQRLAKKAQSLLNAPDEPFLLHDLTSRAASLGIQPLHDKAPTRRNPNSGKTGRKRGGKRR